MYELIQLTQSCYYIESPAKIGVVKLEGNDVCLIDSGSDKEAGRKIKKILDENGWNLKAIYNTHSHADHIGGNKYLQNQTGCEIYAPAMNAGFANYPILEPSFLYAGFPVKELQNKFLLAQESHVQPLTDKVLPDNLSVISLDGHFLDMVGYKTECGVIFLADCLLSKNILDKYKIPFIYDVRSYLETLDRVKDMQGIFVPSHADVTEDISELAEYNQEVVHKLASDILSITDGVCFEIILQKLFDKYGLALDFNQYVLAGSTVKSILAWLKSNGKIITSFENNMLLWNAVK